MRDHAIVSPRFWTGKTGRYLRQHADAQRLAMYLLTCPSSNMIGLYYLPIPTICHELNIPFEGASKALRRVFEGGFAAYDHENELVFVYHMARFQVGEQLGLRDNRVKAVEKQLLAARKSKFYAEFLKLYGEAYKLKLETPFEGGSRDPLRSQDQDQDQDQDQEKKNTECSDPSEAGRSPPESLVPAEPPVMTFPVVARKGGPAEWHLTASLIAEWQQTFPHMAVEAECRSALGWVKANPSKTKTATGMTKFLFGWLTRAQNSGRAGGRPASTGPKSFGEIQDDYRARMAATAFGGGA